jgi:phosphatidylglycerophosphatase A
MIATLGGVGFTPLAPGTAATAVTALILGLVPFSPGALVITFVAVTAIGIWAAGRAERVLGGKDPGVIVIDEVAGMILAVLLLPRTVPVLAAGFVVFRIFDIVKPFPADASQRLPAGLGVMTDDLVAGLYALAVLALARATVGWP